MIFHSVTSKRYEQFANMFKAEMFNPDKWADLFQKSGAKCESEIRIQVHIASILGESDIQGRPI